MLKNATGRRQSGNSAFSKLAKKRMVEDILMEDKHQKSPKPEILETEEEKRLSVVALKKKYIAFARSRFIHSPRMTVRNRDTQWLIELSNRVIND